MIAAVADSISELGGEFGRLAAGKIFRAKIAIVRAVAQHVINDRIETATAISAAMILTDAAPERSLRAARPQPSRALPSFSASVSPRDYRPQDTAATRPQNISDLMGAF